MGCLPTRPALPFLFPRSCASLFGALSCRALLGRAAKPFSSLSSSALNCLGDRWSWANHQCQACWPCMLPSAKHWLASFQPPLEPWNCVAASLGKDWEGRAVASLSWWVSIVSMFPMAHYASPPIQRVVCVRNERHCHQCRAEQRPALGRAGCTSTCHQLWCGCSAKVPPLKHSCWPNLLQDLWCHCC